MMILFSAKGSCALASHIALEEAGADYTLRKIDFATKGQSAPEFLAVNPKGRVPALVTDRGTLSESPAILAYIAQSFPDSPVGAPADPFEFARLQAFNSYLASTVHVAHAHKRRGSRWSDDPAVIEAMTLKVTRNMADCCAMIETEMLAGPWVMGDTYSVADPYLFTICNWLEGDGVDIAGFPKLAGHWERMTQRPAVRAALAAIDA